MEKRIKPKVIQAIFEEELEERKVERRRELEEANQQDQDRRKVSGDRRDAVTSAKNTKLFPLLNSNHSLNK